MHTIPLGARISRSSRLWGDSTTVNYTIIAPTLAHRIKARETQLIDMHLCPSQSALIIPHVQASRPFSCQIPPSGPWTSPQKQSTAYHSARVLQRIWQRHRHVHRRGEGLGLAPLHLHHFRRRCCLHPLFVNSGNCTFFDRFRRG